MVHRISEVTEVKILQQMQDQQEQEDLEILLEHRHKQALELAMLQRSWCKRHCCRRRRWRIWLCRF